ncbi:hypothetical protein BGZ49_003774, partial [Haplosporangium sp. Z 27]
TISRDEDNSADHEGDEHNEGDEERTDVEESELEEEDYYSDLPDSEAEIKIESITDSNKTGVFTPVLNAEVTTMNSQVQENASGLHPEIESENPNPMLSKEAESTAYNLTRELLTAELADCPWIQSTLSMEVIQEIVDHLSIETKYDYLPRVFYVDKEDFDLWRAKDSDDHFFRWNKGNWRGKDDDKAPDEIVHEEVDDVIDEGVNEVIGRGADRVVDEVARGGVDGGVVNEGANRNISQEILSFHLYFCHRSGCPRNDKKKKENDGQEVGQDDRGNPEYAVKGGRKQLRVTYYFRRTGHVLGDPDDFRHLKVIEDTRARIRNLVRLGLYTRRIVSKINLSGTQANSLYKQGKLKPDHILKYEDVYNILHKHYAKETQLAKVDLESMKLWTEKLRKDKNFTVFTMDYIKTVEGVRYKKFAYGFMSPFQRSIYSSNFKQIGLDSTHGTNRSKHELYTIIVQDPSSLSAVPVAFLLTNDHSSLPLTQWLTHIRETIGTPTSLPPMMLRQSIQQFGVHLDTEEKIAAFKEKWSNNNEGKALAYLEKRYFTLERKQRWMKAYRVGKYYAGMDTNNYVESWHNHLKSHFLRGHTNCRGDRLIYILTTDVDEYYQMIAMQNIVRRGRHTRVEINDFKQMKFLEGKTKDELHSFVIDVEGIPNIIERVHNKHIAIESGNLVPAIEFHGDEEDTEDLPRDDVEDDINESLEVIRKGLHDADSLTRCPENARRLKKISDMFASLSRTSSTSGVADRQRQLY